MTIMGSLLLALAASGALGPESTASLRNADARLNAQYRLTLAKMKARDADRAPDGGDAPGFRDALIVAQRAWIVYRDTNCLSVSYEYRHGSAQALSRRICSIRMTEARTAELRRIARGAQPD